MVEWRDLFITIFFDCLNAKKDIRIIKKIIKLQKVIGIRRRKPKIFKHINGGSTYWSLPRKVLEYVVNFTNNNSKVFKRFRHTFCAEELYFQTVIMNSRFRDDIRNDNLRYIDWDSGREGDPAILDILDYDKISSNNQIFARKISQKSQDLVKKINYGILKN